VISNQLAWVGVENLYFNAPQVPRYSPVRVISRGGSGGSRSELIRRARRLYSL